MGTINSKILESSRGQTGRRPAHHPVASAPALRYASGAEGHSAASVHRSLTKSANDLATTAQVIAMMRMQAEAGSPINVLSVVHRAQIVKEDVNRAAQLLEALK